jgi:hypothetical protein
MALFDERKHLSKEQQQQIIKDNEKWVTEGFGRVDMSGYPDFNKLSPEDVPSINGDRHGFNRVDFGPSIKGIQDFVNNPPIEVLERISRETNDPELADRIATQRTGDIAIQFVNQNPDYVATDENYAQIVDKICFNHNQMVLTRLDATQAATELFVLGYWTLENLQTAFEELVKAGSLEMPEGTLRNLTPQQLHECHSWLSPTGCRMRLRCISNTVSERISVMPCLSLNKRMCSLIQRTVNSCSKLQSGHLLKSNRTPWLMMS